MNKQLFRTILIGVAAVAITLTIAFIFSGRGTWETLRFWSVTGPLVLSEILVTASWARLFGKSAKKSFPMMIALVWIPMLYFVFALIMTFLYGESSFSNNALLTIQAVVLFFTLVLVVVIQMAADTVTSHALETAKAEAARISFRATVDSILETLRGRFAADKELKGLFDRLYDAARYAADSTPGAEKIEEELDTKLLELESSAGTIEAKDVSGKILPILSSFRKRETLIKSLR